MIRFCIGVWAFLNGHPIIGSLLFISLIDFEMEGWSL